VHRSRRGGRSVGEVKSHAPRSSGRGFDAFPSRLQHEAFPPPPSSLWSRAPCRGGPVPTGTWWHASRRPAQGQVQGDSISALFFLLFFFFSFFPWATSGAVCPRKHRPVVKPPGVQRSSSVAGPKRLFFFPFPPFFPPSPGGSGWQTGGCAMSAGGPLATSIAFVKVSPFLSPPLSCTPRTWVFDGQGPAAKRRMHTRSRIHDSENPSSFSLFPRLWRVSSTTPLRAGRDVVQCRSRSPLFPFLHVRLDDGCEGL